MDTQTFQTKNDSNTDLEKVGVDTDRLSVFRQQVGITDVLDLGPRTGKRKVRNIGIYHRIAIEEREAKFQYMFSAMLINTCFLAQIVFASALTALGAGHGSHTQITILGAANTVIAAVLTFTKGQGLPNRLRQYQCNLRKVREYIEQRERDFAGLDCRLDVDRELCKISTMYQMARQNDENNDPSTYHAPSASQSNSLSLPVDAPQNQIDQRIVSAIPPIARNELSKESKDAVSRGSQHSRLDHPPTLRPEDSEKWKIAYSVADRLISSRNAPLTSDYTLPAQAAQNPSPRNINSTTARGACPKSHTEGSEEADIASPGPQHSQSPTGIYEHAGLTSSQAPRPGDRNDSKDTTLAACKTSPAAQVGESRGEAGSNLASPNGDKTESRAVRFEDPRESKVVKFASDK